ncbi:hypothetical protein [Nocardia wallacei]|nr:hypothetical protein [Nocardia wallacei]
MSDGSEVLAGEFPEEYYGEFGALPKFELPWVVWREDEPDENDCN